MPLRPIEITVISAKGLKRVKWLGKMDVYVVVALSGGPGVEKKTHVDEGSGPDPIWNSSMSFHVDERHILSFRVTCHRRFHSDAGIGETEVAVSALLENDRDGNPEKYLTCRLKRPSGKYRGELNLSYKVAAETREDEGESSVSFVSDTSSVVNVAGSDGLTRRLRLPVVDKWHVALTDLLVLLLFVFVSLITAKGFSFDLIQCGMYLYRECRKLWE